MILSLGPKHKNIWYRLLSLVWLFLIGWPLNELKLLGFFIKPIWINQPKKPNQAAQFGWFGLVHSTGLMVSFHTATTCSVFLLTHLVSMPLSPKRYFNIYLSTPPVYSIGFLCMIFFFFFCLIIFFITYQGIFLSTPITIWVLEFFNIVLVYVPLCSWLFLSCWRWQIQGCPTMGSYLYCNSEMVLSIHC